MFLYLFCHSRILCIQTCFVSSVPLFFFFNDTATTEIYTLSHTTLFRSVSTLRAEVPQIVLGLLLGVFGCALCIGTDRKSTRLNSSHEWISYAVFCLKKKNESITIHRFI